ncbi:MAG: NAD(P)H-dependent oxidoreductase [Gorillibacterium sp.]|nr:NAD(P)H-dependent oxidoreductase [Gorillibacterium sp.]
MKITILNGSPKGDLSVTLQYVKYIEKKFPQHEFTTVHVASTIKKLEKQTEAFDEVIETVAKSDGVIWAFPLYVFLVHANYKRFIELIGERGAQEAFKDKYTALLATSIHFFDHTALNYMQGTCDDLHMRVTDYFSADMDDLMKANERARLLTFADHLFTSITEKRLTLRVYQPIVPTIRDYTPAHIESSLDDQGQRIVIVADTLDLEQNLGRMVERFRKLTQADVIDISALDIKGGCTGCIKCGFDNHCMYGDHDEMERTYRRIAEYDIIVFAGAIRDRYLSAQWKTFVDRRFFKTHQPQFPGKQLGYLISGPLGQLDNLREILLASAQLDRANLAGILTDEYETSTEIDQQIEAFAGNLIDCSSKHYIRPQTFLGLGGMKIFRDDVWGRLRFVFQADHRYYKKQGLYDFPQKEYRIRAKSLFLILLTKIPVVKKSIQKDLKIHMIGAHQKVLRDKE